MNSDQAFQNPRKSKDVYWEACWFNASRRKIESVPGAEAQKKPAVSGSNGLTDPKSDLLSLS